MHVLASSQRVSPLGFSHLREDKIPRGQEEQSSGVGIPLSLTMAIYEAQRKAIRKESLTGLSSY